MGGVHICNETVALIRARDEETIRESWQLTLRTQRREQI